MSLRIIAGSKWYSGVFRVHWYAGKNFLLDINTDMNKITSYQWPAYHPAVIMTHTYAQAHKYSHMRMYSSCGMILTRSYGASNDAKCCKIGPFQYIHTQELMNCQRLISS